MVISRKAFRNNSSKYYIDRVESNFTTVTTLLRDRGVDLDHKRFLILQGEVESIAQMKPKAANEHDDGLLEYLEDIIGTSKYKTPIQEAAAEVEVLNEVCIEKKGRVQHVEKEKNSLEEKKNKAITYVKNENELAVKQSALYQVYINECEDNTKVTEEAVSQTQAQLDQELGKHRGNEGEIKELEKSYRRGVKECEALERENQGFVKEMAKSEREDVKFEEKRKFLNAKQNKLEKAVQCSKLAGSEATSLIKKYTEDIEQNSAQISSYGKCIITEEKELAEIRESLKGKTQVFSDEIAMKQKSLEPWAEKINQKQSAIALAQSELEITQERCNAGAVAVKELKHRVEALGESRETKVTELKELNCRRLVSQNEVSETQNELKRLAHAEPGVRSLLTEARQKAEEARASLSTTQTQSSVLSGLKRLHDSGRVQGFHGRLGNLGTIDQQYDVAISTACPSLDNIVVDSVEDGQHCINHLRQNNLGRAVFILLDRLPQKSLSPINTPEEVPRLFDLIKPKDDCFKPAFFSVMQNTLVAKDLAQANRIAYGAQRWRVVTLDGQLIDKSGTMSGGGTRVAKGGMSAKLVATVSKDQVSKFETDCETQQQDFQALQARQRELEITLKNTQDGIPLLEIEIQKTQLEIDSIDKNLADVQRRVTEVNAQYQPSKSDKDRISALGKQVTSLEKEVEGLREETVTVEEEIKALQDRILAVGGIKLRSQKAKVDGLREQVETLTNELSTAEISKVKAEKLKLKHERGQLESQEEMSNVVKELENLDGEAKKQTETATEWRKRVEEAQDVRTTMIRLHRILS